MVYGLFQNATSRTATSLSTKACSYRSKRSRTSATTSGMFGARSPIRRPAVRSLGVVDPAHLLAIANRAEADALEALGPGTEVLGVVDPHAGRLVDHDARGVLVRLLPHLPVGGLERRLEQLVDLRVLVEARRLEGAPLPGVEHLADPVVGIGVVRADPIHDEIGRRLRLLHALDHGRPQLADQLGLDADLAEAGGHHGGRLLGL